MCERKRTLQRKQRMKRDHGAEKKSARQSAKQAISSRVSLRFIAVILPQGLSQTARAG